GRKEELALLNKINTQISNSGKMTVITGRRRVGKTSLAIEANKANKSIYLFVSKKSEILLCEEYMKAIKDKFKIPIYGEITKFIDVFRILLDLSTKENFVLIIDEFQEFLRINPSIYSDIQNYWDQFRNKIFLHVIFIGSVHSLMVKIFQNEKEPLFGRADRILYLKPLEIRTIKKILLDSNKYSNKNLFYNYLITGGVPRYLEIFKENEIFNIDEMIDFIFDKNSLLLNEGKNLLIEEFGKEYATYFSILELVSAGRTSRSEIESILEINSGGYLDRLENEYDIISKRRPFNAKQTGKIQKYYIKDNFLTFWFRFIHKNKSSIEAGNFVFIKADVKKNLSTYSGSFLEKFFCQVLEYTQEYNVIGNYWERGNKNEIDIVAINDTDKRILFGEVKLNQDKIRINKLKNKTEKLKKEYPDYNYIYRGFSMDSINSIL
ncbi:MAG: DUF234 domain-containing protein, partial [Spirochaetota bacterium]|nr:DUF234 domain-containing protein [Spirochaetota bacterium]